MKNGRGKKREKNSGSDLDAIVSRTLRKRAADIEVKRKPAHLSEVVRDVLENLEKSDLKKCGQIFVHWKDIVGQPLSQHTRPENVRDQKLNVAVDSSDWLYEIKMNFDDAILEKVQERVGKETIKNIRYHVGEV